MSTFLAKPKWCVSVIVGAVLVGAWAQSELRAQRTTDATDRSAAEAFVNDYRDYLDGQEGRVVIPRTGNPEIDAACLEAYREMRRARQRRHMEEVQREHMKKREIWQGTTAMITQRMSVYEMAQALRHHGDRTTVILPPHAVGVSDSQRESLAPFVELFAKEDPPAPAGRREHFAEFLQSDSPDRCVGWDCRLTLAEEVDDGWLVHMEVLSKLMGLTPKAVVTHRSTYEVWHVSRDGKLTSVEVTPGEEGILGRI